MVGGRRRCAWDSASWPRCCRRSWCFLGSRRPTCSPRHRPLERRLSAACSLRPPPWSCPAGGISLLVELWPTSSRPYIGGSQHNSIIELALGYNGLGRLTGNETGGLGNLNHDVGWDRLFGAGMGSDIAWLLPAAVICVVAGVVLTRRAPRTDPARAALIVWGGWLGVTAVVFSFANGIVHSYYTVALAPAIGACIGIGATLLWQNRFDIRCRGRVVRRCARHHHPGGGVAGPPRRVAAVVAHGCSGRGSRRRRRCYWSSRLVGATVARPAAVLTIVSCLAAPAAFSVATAASSA